MLIALQLLIGSSFFRNQPVCPCATWPLAYLRACRFSQPVCWQHRISEWSRSLWRQWWTCHPTLRRWVNLYWSGCLWGQSRWNRQRNAGMASETWVPGRPVELAAASRATALFWWQQAIRGDVWGWWILSSLNKDIFNISGPVGRQDNAAESGRPSISLLYSKELQMILKRYRRCQFQDSFSGLWNT